MKTALKIAVLTVLSTLFYTYVSHMVPQQITYPPESVELSDDMSTADLVKAGEEIVGGKGTCLGCHTIGSHEAGRFPDLGGIGATAGERRDGMNDVEYLAESLYDPAAYIVEGFNPGMIAADKPPISLSDAEVLAVIAYLQSLGGTPTVTMQTEISYASGSPGTDAQAATPDGGGAAAGDGTAASTGGQTGQELATTYGCVGCHSFDAPLKLLGPSLYDVGKRLSLAELYESILDPDAKVTEGFQPGLMTATLQAVQFYDKVTAHELKTMVDYLAALKGGE